ncbi:hypothetical protein WJX81_000162 [Elliptochloris bilobata]|uniref:Uncharacterized protein n=1 Tax=Elliptochloris bilobata TaxID=381761 RepID=A0AAW1SIB6_9CHLO
MDVTPDAPVDDLVVRSYERALARCIQAHSLQSSGQDCEQELLCTVESEGVAPARPGIKPRGVRHHGYLAAKERAAEQDRQRAQEPRDRETNSGAAPQRAGAAQAAKLGDEALAELLTAWFRAGYLSGQHAAALSPPLS